MVIVRYHLPIEMIWHVCADVARRIVGGLVAASAIKCAMVLRGWWAVAAPPKRRARAIVV